MSIQTRNHIGEIKDHKTLLDAFAECESDDSIWKISFTLGEERLRLIREGNDWIAEDVLGNRPPRVF